MELYLLVNEATDINCLACEGKITQSLIKFGVDPVQDLIGEDGFKHPVVLDLEKTAFIDSSGIGWLLGVHRRFQTAGGRLILHSIPPMVLQVIQLLQLNRILNIRDDQETALALARQEKGQA